MTYRIELKSSDGVLLPAPAADDGMGVVQAWRQAVDAGRRHAAVRSERICVKLLDAAGTLKALTYCYPLPSYG